MSSKTKSLFSMHFAVFLSVEVLFCFTPAGTLPAIGSIVATFELLPVIITAQILGRRAGVMMGLFAGLFRFIVWSFMPPTPAYAFLFTPLYKYGEYIGNWGSLAVCFVPRILTGAAAGVSYKAMANAFPGKRILQYTFSSMLGSFTNTFSVEFGAWIFFGGEYSALMGVPMLIVVGTTVLTRGIPEAAICAVVTTIVCKPLKSLLDKYVT